MVQIMRNEMVPFFVKWFPILDLYAMKNTRILILGSSELTRNSAKNVIILKFTPIRRSTYIKGGDFLKDRILSFTTAASSVRP